MSKLQAQPIEHLSLADASDLGRMIFKARDEAGESVENLARRTRISQRLLRALEAGDLHKLPAPGQAHRLGSAVDNGKSISLLQTILNTGVTNFPDKRIKVVMSQCKTGDHQLRVQVVT